MQHNRTLRVITAFLLLTAGIILFLILNVCIGTVSIPFKDILSSIRGQEVLNARILWDIRMPRTLAALILGGALALAGYLLQTFFHNPIAGPFVLGISSGAKMMVALFMVFFMGRSIRVTSFTMILAAFLGAMICMGFVLLMARRVNRMSMLVVSGVMIGYICSAITEFVVTFAEDAEIVNLHNWKLFRDELESGEGDVGGGFPYLHLHLFTGKALKCLSDGRRLCTEHGSECAAFADCSGGFIQCPFGMYCGICGTNLLRGNCGAAPC